MAGGRPILRITMRRRAVVGTWPLLAPLLAAGTVILAVVFADQTFATVLEATRIRTAIGPSQEWYTENLRYYYLVLPTVDGAISRRFAFLFTALSLFPALFMMLRRKRIAGIARGPAWRLMGIIFATIFFLMFTPTKWIHHFGLFAAVGGAMAALATVMVSPVVLRSARNRMAFLALVFFVVALCFASVNGWWYVSNYGVPFNNSVPAIGGVTISTIFFALFAVAALWAFWLHVSGGGDSPFRGPAHGRADPDRRRLHGRGVRGVDGHRRDTPVPDLLQRLGQRTHLRRGLRHGRRRPGRTGLQRRVLCGRCRVTTARWGRSVAPVRPASPPTVCPTGSSRRPSGSTIRSRAPTTTGTGRSGCPRPGVKRVPVPLPYGLDPARVPVAGHVFDRGTTGEQTRLGVVRVARRRRRTPADHHHRGRHDLRRQRRQGRGHRADRAN